MRILVLQTTRMGDMIQTSPLLRGLRVRYPEAHIAVMVRNMGKIIGERNPDVNEVIVYDEDEMFVEMRAQDSDRLLHAYRCAEACIRRLRDARYDLVYNCTHSIASAMLLKLAGVPQVVGAHLSDDWQFVLRGAWINYFFTSVFHREYNDLNLCDITRHFVPDAPAGCLSAFEVRDEDRAFVERLLAAHRVGPDAFIVCMQLGASEESKRWSAAHFARLARMLGEQRQARIFLVGVKEEAPLGQAFEEQAPGAAVALFGQTTIPQLGALLERANLLVTNDTGTMHLAAAVKCPTVLVSVGYVHFRETGPYGVGHCAVERHRGLLGRADGVPGGLEERTAIQPEQVLQAIGLTLAVDTTRPVAQIAVTKDLTDVDLFMTRFAPDGCLEWYPVLRRPLAETDFLRIAYRTMWLEHLGAQPSGDEAQASVRLMLGYFNPPKDGPVEAWCTTHTTVFGQLARLAERGIRGTEELLACLRQRQPAAKAQQFVSELMRLDEDMRLFGELHNACKPLVLISRYERDNLEGADPLVLAETTRQIYRDCLARATLMQAKLEHVAHLWAADP